MANSKSGSVGRRDFLKTAAAGTAAVVSVPGGIEAAPQDAPRNATAPVVSRDAETGLRICTAVRPVWIVRGAFAEGAGWFDSFLAIDAPGLPAGVRGAALVGRAQLALSSDPAGARQWATDGLALCRAAGIPARCGGIAPLMRSWPVTGSTTVTGMTAPLSGDIW